MICSKAPEAWLSCVEYMNVEKMAGTGSINSRDKYNASSNLNKWFLTESVEKWADMAKAHQAVWYILCKYLHFGHATPFKSQSSLCFILGVSLKKQNLFFYCTNTGRVSC